MGMIGNPIEQDFKGMVRGYMIHNCPVTTKAITNARAIHGPSLKSVRGKTVCSTGGGGLHGSTKGDHGVQQDCDTGCGCILC
jgi:hypothetical protein